MINEIKYLNISFIVLFIVFFLLFSVSLYFNIHREYHSQNEFALIEAKASYNKDLLYRRWASMHGGVYVPITEQTPPNPLLNHIPDRDITSEFGVKLTLVNPAYMTRQVHEIGNEQYGVKGHITSLNPLREENKPDEWEKKALELFETGANEYSSFDIIDGKKYLRYMHSMTVESSCLKCHASQGYEVGEVRGGISVSVPMETYEISTIAKVKKHVATSSSMFLVVISLLVLAYRSFSKELVKRNLLLLEKKESESLMKETQLIAQIGSWKLDLATNQLTWSDEVFRIFGYLPQEFSPSYQIFLDLIHPDDREAVDLAYSESLKYNRNGYEIEHRIIQHGTDDVRYVQERCVHQRDSEGKVIQSAGIIHDITERKRAEKNIIESEKQYRSLFENMNAGFVLFEVLRNEQGVPVDLKILAANKGFEKRIGVNLEFAIGQPLTKVLPGIENDEANWIGIYSKVAATGESTQFEHGSELLGNYFSVSAFQVAPDKCAVTFVDITQRIIHENKLRDEKERIRTILDMIGDPIFVKDNQHRITMANRAFYEMFAINEENVIGNTLVEKVPENERIHFLQVDRNVLDTGIPDKREEELTINNETKTITTRKIRFTDISGNKFLVGSIHDITERKKNEIELEKAKEYAEKNERIIFEKNIELRNQLNQIIELEKRLQFALSSSKTGAWDLDLQNYSVQRTLEHDKIFGYQELLPEWTYDMFLEHVIPEFKSEVDKKFKHAIEHMAEWNFECQIRRKDDEIRWIWLCGQHLMHEDGESHRMAGIIQDITERKLSESALKESEERLRLATEQSNVAVWEYDFNKNSMSRSLNHDKLYGLEWQPIWNINTFLHATHPDDREYSNSHIMNSVAPNGPDNYSFDFRVVFPDGTIRWLFVNARVIERNESGQGLRVRGILMDITERKQLQYELEQANSWLEFKVQQRTAQLEASNKELEAFSYSVSHDLRAPLRHINGYVDLLSKKYYESLDEKARNYIEVISGASKKMGILIDDLLEFSKTGRKEFLNSEVDLNLVIQEILKELEADLKGRKINWNIQDMPHVFGDNALLKQAWKNLIGNAIKYTRKTSLPKISIGYKDETNYFVFFVRDNGVGFDMRYAHKLFGVFQRLHSQAEFEGTGIGLANVQRIIHKHAGKVWAEAELDKGATFYFSLPKFREERL